MSRQQRRSTERQSLAPESSRRWFLWTGGGLALVVLLVIGFLAGLGVFNEEEPPPDGVLPTAQMEAIASAGHSLGDPDAPVTLLEFGDFQ